LRMRRLSSCFCFYLPPSSLSRPTRRSSDLDIRLHGRSPGGGPRNTPRPTTGRETHTLPHSEPTPRMPAEIRNVRFCVGFPRGQRSEEHTSELQSRENLVCRLLHEKKSKRDI